MAYPSFDKQVGAVHLAHGRLQETDRGYKTKHILAKSWTPSPLPYPAHILFPSVGNQSAAEQWYCAVLPWHCMVLANFERWVYYRCEAAPATTQMLFSPLLTDASCPLLCVYTQHTHIRCMDTHQRKQTYAHRCKHLQTHTCTLMCVHTHIHTGFTCGEETYVIRLIMWPSHSLTEEKSGLKPRVFAWKQISRLRSVILKRTVPQTLVMMERYK